MESIKTFVINLNSAKVRKEYMLNLLFPYSFLDVEFVEAIDGRKLTEEQRLVSFNDEKCLKLLGRQLNGGEIGCTLSHRKCYQKLLDSKLEYGLVLEDDISLIRDFNDIKRYDIDKYLRTDNPIILILSGDYWYWRKNKICSVYDCVGAYAYFINKSAAMRMLSIKATSVADHWLFYKTLGIKIKAIMPYMIDANLNMDLLSSDVAQDEWGIHRKKMSFMNVIKGYQSGLIKSILKNCRHFESKIRVINNKIVK